VDILLLSVWRTGEGKSRFAWKILIKVVSICVGCMTYNYLSSLCWYQIILLGNRGMCVSNLPQVTAEKCTAGT